MVTCLVPKTYNVSSLLKSDPSKTVKILLVTIYKPPARSMSTTAYRPGAGQRYAVWVDVNRVSGGIDVTLKKYKLNNTNSSSRSD